MAAIFLNLVLGVTSEKISLSMIVLIVVWVRVVFI